MTKKVVDLTEFRAKKAVKKQIDKLDEMYYEYMVQETDPVVRKGYQNFMRFIKRLDKKYGDGNEDQKVYQRPKSHEEEK